MIEEIWQKSDVVNWSQILLDSYAKLLGRELIERSGNPQDEAKAVFFAPFVVVSHGKENDPILNYGNQVALKLWEMSWSDFICTPSRLTAEPGNQKKREKMLIQVALDGFIENYQGIRISSTGKRFFIDKVVIWNLFDWEGITCGQAATFPLPKMINC